jgi:hypothetical protein
VFLLLTLQSSNSKFKRGQRFDKRFSQLVSVVSLSSRRATLRGRILSNHLSHVKLCSAFLHRKLTRQSIDRTLANRLAVNITPSPLSGDHNALASPHASDDGGPAVCLIRELALMPQPVPPLQRILTGQHRVFVN